MTPVGNHTSAAAALTAWPRRLHAALMPDYNRRATVYWWLAVCIGTSILALTLHRLAALPASALVQIALGTAIAVAAGFFPLRIPHSKSSFVAGEIFIFLLLLMHGPAAATLAAAGEGLIGSWRTSRRWTSRLATPAMAAIAMSATGWMLTTVVAGLRSRGLDSAGLVLVATMVCAVLYFVCNTVLINAVLALKRSSWPKAREMFGDVGWIGITYAGSASIACLLFVSYEQAGIGVLMAGVPIIAMLLTTLHYYFREQEVAKRNAQMSLAKEEAVAANLAKSRFLANMSHELRTPLNAVIGAAQLLRLEKSDPERQEYLIDAIQRGGTNLLGLIENTLDLARIEAGEMPLQPTDFHLVECIEAALSTAALTANSKGLRLSCIIDPVLPAWRHGAAERLRQVILNLLGNAVKFTERGEVIVRVKPGSAPDAVRLSVCDTGVGIGEASLAHIFEPFRQADDGADRRFGGSGLGLTIVQQLVKTMGGRVGVTSTLGQGSCFEFELPLPPARVPMPEVAPLPQRIVYFEPHDASAQALQAQLERLGCAAERGANAEQLRQALQRASGPAKPWLMLATDAGDPMALLEPVADLVEPDRVIAMAHDMRYEADQARDRAHLSRHVVKPITRAALVSRLTEATERSLAPSLPPQLLTEAQLRGRRHVLVVEDDALNRSIACSMLQHAGYSVSAAHDGEQALQMLPRIGPVDLVLMDWQMPGMDGLEVTRRLRAGAAGPIGQRVPIVALTANAFVEDRATCLAAGMDDFLTKPLLDANLRAMAARWADGSRVARGGTKEGARSAAAGAAAPAPAPARAPEPAPARGTAFSPPGAPAHREASGQAVFDPSVLAALPMVSDGSAPEFGQEMLAMFIDSTAATLSGIEHALADGDVAKLQRLVHTLKSGGASVGALELSALAEAHETALRQGQPPQGELPTQLAGAIGRLRRHVQCEGAIA